MERVSFPAEGLEFVVRPLRSVQQLAVLGERSKVKGRIDEARLMVSTLVMGISEPKQTEADVLKLMKEHPEATARLAVRIIELTTG